MAEVKKSQRRTLKRTIKDTAVKEGRTWKVKVKVKVKKYWLRPV
jgi:hypothetical protein